MSVEDGDEYIDTSSNKLDVLDELSSDISDDDRTVEESLARTVIPWNRDDNRARYLGLRACGFTSREALRLIGIVKSNLSNWRTDEKFAEIESKLQEYRRELADEYVELEFKRNFRLVMEKDFQVLKKSLSNNGEVLSKLDSDYLLKMRQYYTPQQYQIINAIASGSSGENGDNDFNFTKAVLKLARTTERMEVSVK